jgi:hypothetical protein
VNALEGRTTQVNIIRLPGIGGFPSDNIGYWKVVDKLTAEGTSKVLHVQFKSGGFIDLPDITEDQFTSLVFGEPF